MSDRTPRPMDVLQELNSVYPVSSIVPKWLTAEEPAVRFSAFMATMITQAALDSDGADIFVDKNMIAGRLLRKAVTTGKWAEVNYDELVADALEDQSRHGKNLDEGLQLFLEQGYGTLREKDGSRLLTPTMKFPDLVRVTVNEYKKIQ